MGTITLSVPDDLKSKMDTTDWINWSSVARKAFSETLKDLDELQARKKLGEISGISSNDSREVKKTVAKKALNSIDKTSRKLKVGKMKTMTRTELDKLMGY